VFHLSGHGDHQVPTLVERKTIQCYFFFASIETIRLQKGFDQNKRQNIIKTLKILGVFIFQGNFFLNFEI
jgi:hypothetical protein